MVISRQIQRLPPAEQLAGDKRPWRVEPALSGGGFFFEGVVHTFDFLDYLLGPIESVRAFAGNKGGAYPAEDVVAASYRFASGVHGSGAWCYTADFEEEYNEIVGTKGRIRFSTSAPMPIRVMHGNDVEELPVGDPPHVHQPMIQSIVDELNGSGHCPSTGESAARTGWVMDQILGEFRKASGLQRS